MISQSENLHPESLITLDLATYEFWQQELAMLRHDNEQLQRELAECNSSQPAFIDLLGAAQSVDLVRKLSEKVDQLQAILDNSPAMIYVKDRQGQFLLVNHQVEATFHLAKEQIQGKSNYEVFPKELADVFWQNDQQVLAAGTALRFEEVISLEDGPHTYLSLKFPLFNADGLAYAICGISTDISDRKQADAERFRLAAIVESSDDAIISKTLDGMIVSWNAAAEQIFGYRAAEVIGQPISKLIPDNRLGEEAQILEKLKRGERIEHFETIRKHKDGTLIDLALTVSSVKDANGNTVGASTIARDISEHKRLEAERQQAAVALHRSEERYRCLMATTSPIVWISAPDGQSVDSPSWCAYTGQSLEKLKNFEWLEAIHPEDCERTGQIWNHARETKNWYETEYRIQAADGSYRYFDVKGVPMLDEDGNIQEWFGTCTDIDDRKRAEAELKQRTTELENTLQALQHTQMQMIQSEKMSGLGQLVAGVAHEINNPVNFIYGNLSHADAYAQDLLELLQLYQQHYPTPHLEIQQKAENIDLEFLTEDLPKLLTSMKIGASRIQKIVASLRNFSRMDEAEMKEVNIHEGIDSTLMILQHRLKAKHDFPEIEVIKVYGDLPLVECYTGQLNQVFMNILCNSIDALEESFGISNCLLAKEQIASEQKQNTAPTIWIRTETVDAHHVRIFLSDNGPGMTEAVCKRLFDPFFTTKPVGKGTGMGMSISYQIITEKHQGSLHCVSSVGQGTEFVIEIPIQQQAQQLSYRDLERC